jgi:arylsulfate sulfotransferase
MTRTIALVFAVMSMCVLISCSSSGRNPESDVITPGSADLLTGQSVQFQTNITSKKSRLTWSVNGTPSGNASVGTIDGTGNYTAPATQPAAPVMVTVTDSARPSEMLSATVTVVAPGQVTSTAHPQVALYTIAPPVSAMVAVQFGTDTTYGLTTWTQPAAGNGASLGVFVAGMKPNTLYHMRGVLQMPDGSQLNDNDLTFTTGSIPATAAPVIAVTNPNGMVPQSGVEMLDLLSAPTPIVVTDLQGNILWWLRPTGSAADLVQPIKLLPNGHFIVQFSPTSTAPLSAAPLPPGTVDEISEIDLTGALIRQITIDTLNSRLATAGLNYTAGVFHHDVTVLPNGHWIVLVSATKEFTNLTGLPGTTNVLGDALIDLDTNLNPVWLWNTFDHLDVNRHPFSFPDWTHSNAILYSPTDGNLLLSMRHQNWIIKIDYADGKGAGDIVWHLGEGGDFTLQGGVDPTDWFYAQHGPSFTTQTTAGKFGLTVFDNGDDRIFPNNESCTQAGDSTCPYSTAMILNLDEGAMTATFAFHDVQLPGDNHFCQRVRGDADLSCADGLEHDDQQ